MSRTISLLAIFVLLSCDDTEKEIPSSVRISAVACQKTSVEMLWLADLIRSAKTEPSQNGNIYRGSYDGYVVFIHQPIVLSCMPCIVYDCEGNRLDISTMDTEKLRFEMKPHNIVYQPY